ncbi:hypothetical protein [Tropicimonas sp. IMCC6043]|uniref:hypothetical protein n=1 Tax=Tropicimonas sp. IMCC6043 TaxID=2510645 RepID=UPI00101B9008|nr:hypothetical protein [Tropicimonas sp. IMCC6043]RYH11855.1 hypothetical protein EU800_04300 [Tropicimonas sp. IMCC6043]
MALAPASALACRCKARSLDEAALLADIVVSAKIVAANDLDLSRREFVLQILEAFKGRPEERLTVLSTSDCAFFAEPGETYLMFIRDDLEFGLHTDICSGNLPMDDPLTSVAVDALRK